MERRLLHQMWDKFRPGRSWYFVLLSLVVTLLSATVCGFALRSNNLHMVALRNDVYQADKNNGDVETALRNLRTYLYSHMNTNLESGSNAVHPPIQLKYTYERLVGVADQSASVINSKIYTDAQHYCETAIPNGFSGKYRISCIQDYVTTHGVTPQSIPKNLYQFDFVAAKWSCDLAGWSLVATVVFLIITVGSAIAQVITIFLKRRKRSE